MLSADQQCPPSGSPMCCRTRDGSARTKAQHAEELGVDPKVLEKPAAWLAAHYSTAAIRLTAKTGGEGVYAVANQGRWLAHCPDCPGATMVSHADQRFMCVECGNVGNGGSYRPVIWPKSWAEIAALLDQRPDIAARNWSPPETLASLRTENAEHLPAYLHPTRWAARLVDGKLEGHTHKFPKRLTTTIVECLECELGIPRSDIELDRQGA